MNEITIKVLLVEDNPPDACFIEELLATVPGPDFSLGQVRRLAEGIGRLGQEKFDLVLLDLGLPDSSGLETLRQMLAAKPAVPVIILTGLADEQLAAQAISLGAQDFLVKGRFDGQLLTRAIRYAIERKKSEQLLKNSEEKFRVFFESAGVGAVQLDQQGRFLLMNDRYCQILGYRREELLTKNFLEVTHPDDRDRDHAGFRRLLNGEIPEYVAEKRYLCKYGRVAWVHLTATLARGADGRPQWAAAIVEDITARKRAEVELQKIQKIESLGLLAGGIAHDFNNILTAILGNISLAKLELPPGEQAAKRLDLAEQALLRARGLAQQLLTFAKGGAPITETVAVPPLVSEAVDLALSGSSVRAAYSFQAELRPVEADEGQLSQALRNLVINAVQAMPEGGILGITAVNESLSPANHLGLPAGQYVRIGIADQGVGIPEEIQDSIFDPYFTTKQQGSGLGLAISFSIAKRHGGTITVDSEPGQGSTFSILLPASSKTVIIAEQEAVAEELVTRKGRILVMDDQEAVSGVALEMLQHLGYQAVAVCDGAEAVTAFREALAAGEPFAAVITDLTVPAGMGGQEAVRHLLAMDPAAKVIVASGYSNDPVMANYAAYGFKGVLPKPFSLADLSRILKEVLGNQAA